MVTTVDGFERKDTRQSGKKPRISERQYAVEKLLDSLKTEDGEPTESTSNSRFFKHASSEKMFYHVVSDVEPYRIWRDCPVYHERELFALARF